MPQKKPLGIEILGKSPSSLQSPALLPSPFQWQAHAISPSLFKADFRGPLTGENQMESQLAEWIEM
jgi:hypothetical protein